MIKEKEAAEMVNSDLSVAIIHFSPLTSRRVLLERSLPPDLKVNWVTEKDIGKILVKEIVDSSIFGLSVRSFGKSFKINSYSKYMSRKRSVFRVNLLYLGSFLSGFLKKKLLSSLPPRQRLKDNWLELQRMHFAALQVCISEDREWALFLEDDAMPESVLFWDSVHYITRTKSDKPTWVAFNAGGNLIRTKSDPQPGYLGFFDVKPASNRSTVSFLVNRSMLNQMWKTIEKDGFPNWLPIDLGYQILVKKLKCRTIWQEPASVLEGSSANHFPSGFRDGDQTHW
jgi:hypothetical protein